MKLRLAIAIPIAVLIGASALTAGNHAPPTTVSLSSRPMVMPSVMRQEIKAQEHQDAVTAAKALAAAQVQAQAQADAAARAARQQVQDRAARTASRSAAPRVSQPRAPVYGSQGGLPAGLLCIRQHESGNNYADITGNMYYGAYQYSKSTWAMYGGFTYASDAPPHVQDERALSDYNKGYGQIHQNWPTTSRQCGL